MSTTIERYVIRHISGTKANQVEEFDFNKQELSIGRTSGSDIQYDPGSAANGKFLFIKIKFFYLIGLGT